MWRGGGWEQWEREVSEPTPICGRMARLHSLAMPTQAQLQPCLLASMQGMH